MYVVANALKNLVRNKGRNILAGSIMLFIIVSVAIALVITRTTKGIIEEQKRSFGSMVSIEIDHEKLLEEDRNLADGPTGNDLLSFGESEYLKDVSYEAVVWGDALTYKSPYLPEDSTEMCKAYFVGSQNPAIDSNFESGKMEIIEGRKYENSRECLIEQDFAKLNNLTVGSTMTIDVRDKGYHDPARTSMEFTVCGIYADYRYVGSGDVDRSEDPTEVFMDTMAMIDMGMLNMDEETALFPFFQLKEPEMLDAYTKQLREKGLSEDMVVRTDVSGYKKVVGPIEAMTQIVTTFMIVVIILGSTILLLLSILTIRERKYEIGVLRSMGMSKSKTALGLVLESAFIASLCLVVGLSVAGAAAQPVADVLLENQLLASTRQTENVEFVDFDDAVEPLSQIEVKLDPTSILAIVLVSLGIVVVSSSVGIFYVTRYEPIRILSERN